MLLAVASLAYRSRARKTRDVAFGANNYREFAIEGEAIAIEEKEQGVLWARIDLLIWTHSL